MTNRSLKLFLIVSLVFNIAVLTVFSILFFSQRVTSEENQTFNGRRICDPRRCVNFARRFGLEPEKAERFASAMADFSEEERALRMKIIETRGQLMDLLRESPPKEDEIMKKVDRISSLQGRMEKILVGRLLRVNTVLSEPERERLHRHLMHRMGGASHGGGRRRRFPGR